jgi:hypothetical protein
MRDGWRRIAERPMARRMTPEGQTPRGPRRAVLLGWLAAAAAIALLAFIVGRPDAVAPTPSPGPEASPSPITFGTSQDPATGEALDPTDRFTAGDTFVYSLAPAEPVETDTVTLEILRVDDEELISEQVAEIEAGPVIGLAVSADEMLEFYGAGEFVMRIYLDPADPLGEGRFMLVESPEAT